MSSPVFTQTFCVAGAILEKDGRILLVREGNHSEGVDTGKWSHPAGWIDVGEDPIEAVKREVLEETGYSFEPTELLGIYSLVRKDTASVLGGLPHAIKIIFKGRIINNNQGKIAEDIVDTKWFDPEDIQTMDSEALRDSDIKQMVNDYFDDKEIRLDFLHHTTQN